MYVDQCIGGLGMSECERITTCLLSDRTNIIEQYKNMYVHIL